MTTLNLQVAAGTDDAFQDADGSGYSRTGATLQCNADTNPSDVRQGGMRFTGVTIPQGTTILSATLEVVPLTDNDANVAIKAEDVDNAVDFDATENVYLRVRTTASVNWVQDNVSVPATSPDIAAVIQEVIDRAGWVSGNALVVFLDGKSDVDKRLEIAAFEHATLAAAKLDITYGSPQTVTPSPLAIPISLPAPTMVVRYTATPTPIAVPLSLPTPAISLSLIAPSPLVVPIAFPDVHLVSVLLSPDPLAILIAFPAPSLAGVRILTPSPIAIPIAFPSPGVGIDTPIKRRHRAVITTPAGVPVGQIIG